MKLTSTFKRLSLLLFIAVLALSCGQEIQTVNIEHRYSLDMPKTFKPAKGLNEDASLQYQDPVRELYVIVIDEPKDVLATSLEANSLYDAYSNDLKGYSQLIIDGMDSSVSVKEMPPFEDTVINGMKAKLVSFEGVSSGYRIYWKLAFIEGKNRFYQVMVWTETARRKKHEAKMTGIINSFKDTDKSKSQ